MCMLVVPVERLVVGVGDELVEGLVGLLTHAVLVLHPDRLDRVAHLYHNRQRDKHREGGGKEGVSFSVSVCLWCLWAVCFSVLIIYLSVCVCMCGVLWCFLPRCRP